MALTPCHWSWVMVLHTPLFIGQYCLLISSIYLLFNDMAPVFCQWFRAMATTFFRLSLERHQTFFIGLRRCDRTHFIGVSQWHQPFFWF